MSTRTPEDDARIRAAEESQAQMLAALPTFPAYGFYVKTGLAGYGPDLDETDTPCMSWDDVASLIADELDQAADFAAEGASFTGSEADETHVVASASFERARIHGASFDDYAAYVTHLGQYREAWNLHKRAEDLSLKAVNFRNLAKTGDDVAPLYQGRPDLRHARIWNLISSEFPYDVSHNTRLYVWECEEEPDSEDS